MTRKKIGPLQAARNAIKQWQSVAHSQSERANDALDALGASRSALGELLAMIYRIGGFMFAEDQRIVRNAKRVLGGS